MTSMRMSRRSKPRLVGDRRGLGASYFKSRARRPAIASARRPAIASARRLAIASARRPPIAPDRVQVPRTRPIGYRARVRARSLGALAVASLLLLGCGASPALRAAEAHDLAALAREIAAEAKSGGV